MLLRFTAPRFLHLCIAAPTVVHWNLRALEIALTFPRLVYVNNFVTHSFLNFFQVEAKKKKKGLSQIFYDLIKGDDYFPLINELMMKTLMQIRC